MRSTKKRNQPRRKTKTNKRNQKYNSVVPKSLDAFAASEYECTLRYVDDQTLKNVAGSLYQYWRIKMGDLFDPNPLVLTGGVSGFIELAGLYRRYLVTHITIDSIIVNNEAFPVTITQAPSDIDLATLISGPIPAVNVAELPLQHKRILSSKGGQDRGRIHRTIDLARFTGQPGAYRDSLTYSSLVNTSPATNTYYNIVALATSNFTAAGVTQTTTYTFRVRFTQRQTPIISSLERVNHIPLTPQQRIDRAVQEFKSCLEIAKHFKLPDTGDTVKSLASLHM